MLDREQRTISNFAEIEVKERLHKWTRAGQYGFVFDNIEDTLSLGRKAEGEGCTTWKVSKRDRALAARST